MSDRIGIEFLRGIAMRAPDMMASKDFYSDVWGLVEVASDDATVYLRGHGPESYVYSLTDGDTFGIEYINFGMKSRDRLKALYSQLKSDGAPLMGDIHDLTTPGGGVGFYLRDPDDRRLRVAADVEEHADAAETFAMPTKVGHVVLNSPGLATTEAFYRDVLGFRLSDFYVDRMSFMRCSTDHHSIGLMQNTHASVNHVAFEVPDIDSYMRAIGRLKRAGHPLGWGPGRHGPGNNAFAYFTSPSGYVIEFISELQQIDEETHIAKEWTWGDPETGDRWGMAGPPTPAIRSMMLGRPDEGFPAEGTA